MPARTLPPKHELRTLLLSGWTVADFVNAYDVSRQAVYQRLKAEGLWDLRSIKRTSYRDFIPWRIRVTHWNFYTNECLHLYLRNLGLGPPVPAQKANQLTLFVTTMEDKGLVVDYDYDSIDGFRYVPRQPGDKHYVRWPSGPDAPEDRRDEILAALRR